VVGRRDGGFAELVRDNYRRLSTRRVPTRSPGRPWMASLSFSRWRVMLTPLEEGSE